MIERFVLRCVLACALAPLSGGSFAHEPARATVSQIFSQPLVEWPGKQVRSFVVEFPPNGESVPHTHAGPILAYVIRGTWVMRMEGGNEQTVRAGEVAYEQADHKHVLSRNASSTEPLQLLVFYISDAGAAVSLPTAR